MWSWDRRCCEASSRILMWHRFPVDAFVLGMKKADDWDDLVDVLCDITILCNSQKLRFPRSTELPELQILLLSQNIQTLQRIQNSLASAITATPEFQHITPALKIYNASQSVNGSTSVNLNLLSWSLKSSSLWIAENTDIPSRNATRCRLRTTCELLWGRLRWGCWRDRRCTTKLHEMRQHSCPTKYHDRRRRLWTACLALWDLLDHSEYHLNRITYGQTNK